MTSTFLKRLPLRSRLFAATVALPTLCAALYFGAVASDVYVSESRFVVRAAEQPEGMGGFGALFKGFSTAGSEQVLLVRDYVLSREVMRDVDRDLKVRESFGRGDVFSRFPAPWTSNSYEEFVDYYQQHVKVEADPQSSVGVLTVRGFDPAKVQALNATLLGKARDRIRELNAQIRTDSLKIAERELERAQERLGTAESKLASYRVNKGVMDPERQAGLELESEQAIRGQLIAAQARYNQIRAIAPQSPQLPALAAEVGALRSAAVQAKWAVTGGSSSRAIASETFQQLQLEREIAAKTLAAASDAMVRARVEAERRHLYLEAVSAPSKPDDALYPKRLQSILSVFLIGLVLWGIASLGLTGVREHGNKV